MTAAKPLVAIVDDEESVGLATQRLLRSIDMEAESFRTGEALLEALAALPSHRPDCLIVDVQMPGLSGLELQEELQGSGLPIVFITAHDDVGVRERALQAGAVGFLRKPFDAATLIRAVRAALKHHGV